MESTYTCNKKLIYQFGVRLWLLGPGQFVELPFLFRSYPHVYRYGLNDKYANNLFQQVRLIANHHMVVPV